MAQSTEVCHSIYKPVYTKMLGEKAVQNILFHQTYEIKPFIDFELGKKKGLQRDIIKIHNNIQY